MKILQVAMKLFLLFTLCSQTIAVIDPIHKFAMAWKSIPSEADVMLVADSSGSIGPVEFDAMKMALKSVVQQLSGSNMRFGLISFSSVSLEHKSLTYNRHEIMEAIDSMPYMGGATETGPALRRASSALLGSRSSASKHIVLLTDGHPTDPDAYVRADQVKRSGIDIIGISFGQFNQQNLQMLCTYQKAFHKSTIHEINQMFKEISRGITPNEHEITVEVQVTNKPLRFRDSLQLEVKITNHMKIAIPSDAVVTIWSPQKPEEQHFKRADAYIGEEIPPFEYGTVKMQLTPTAIATSETLPSTLDIQVRDNSGRVYGSIYNSMNMTTELFVQEFLDDSDKGYPRVNILLFGRVGAGKSTLGSSMATSISVSWVNFLESGLRGLKSFTLSLTKKMIEDLPITIIDTLGLLVSDPESYEQGVLEVQLAGELPAGFNGTTMREIENYRRNISTLPSRTLFQLRKWAGFDDRVHVVIFVVDIGVTKDAPDEKIRLKQALHTIQAKGIPYLFVVTRLHRVTKIKERFAEISDYFGVPLYKIYPVSAYINDTTKDFEKDKLAFQILQDAYIAGRAQAGTVNGTKIRLNAFIVIACTAIFWKYYRILWTIFLTLFRIVRRIVRVLAAPLVPQRQPRPHNSSSSSPSSSSTAKDATDKDKEDKEDEDEDDTNDKEKSKSKDDSKSLTVSRQLVAQISGSGDMDNKEKEENDKNKSNEKETEETLAPGDPKQQDKEKETPGDGLSEDENERQEGHGETEETEEGREWEILKKEGETTEGGEKLQEGKERENVEEPGEQTKEKEKEKEKDLEPGTPKT